MPKSEQRQAIRSQFIRTRNTLLTQADFSPLFDQAKEHQHKYQIEYSDTLLELWQTTLALFALHCTAHPQGEKISWTINMQDPLVNLFFVGNTSTGDVTGRIFTENVKTDRSNSFFQEVLRPHKPLRRSYVDFDGHDPIIAAERFYWQSEQRPARFFQRSATDFIMFGAHPDYDENWFLDISHADLPHILEEETIVPIETRPSQWYCGCNKQKIIEVIGGSIQSSMEDFFGDDDTIIANCPRCQAHYKISKDDI